jgi:hypothetical protein
MSEIILVLLDFVFGVSDFRVLKFINLLILEDLSIITQFASPGASNDAGVIGIHNNYFITSSCS